MMQTGTEVGLAALTMPVMPIKAKMVAFALSFASMFLNGTCFIWPRSPSFYTTKDDSHGAYEA